MVCREYKRLTDAPVHLNLVAGRRKLHLFFRTLLLLWQESGLLYQLMSAEQLANRFRFLQRLSWQSLIQYAPPQCARPFRSGPSCCIQKKSSLSERFCRGRQL